MKRKVTIKIPKALIFIVAFLFIAIIAKLAYVSLSKNIDGIDLHELANNRYTKTDVIYAKRGNIYDKDGETLASTVNSYKIIAILSETRTEDPKNPQHVVDKEGTAKMLNEMLDIDYDTALDLLNKEDRYQVEFGTKGQGISESLKNKIEALDMPGIIFEGSQKRTYSMGQFASYIIGYAKVKEEGDIVGELGLESYYDQELSGKDGKTTYQTDAYGYTLPSANIITEDAVNGDDIYLTLDSNVQMFAETLTDNLSKNYKMDWMIFSVMDAKTGAIIASSTYPTFNPNDLNTISFYMNPLVSSEYEPGSTMKIFSFATSIEEGKYNGQDLYDSGCITIDDATICDFNNKKGWGKISFDTGFAYSSNVAAATLGVNLGTKTLTDYYKKLGFGTKTGIELANEIDGIINFKYRVELATAAFGQGITVTPIQMLQALSALTNNGTVLKPYIVDKIVNDAGETIFDGKRTEVAKVYSKETMDYMKSLMHNVVYDGLSGKIWQPTKTTMIGKTGTAQIASPKGGYLNGEYDYIRSFAGIFPEEDPKYIVYVAVKQLNAASATPIANELTKAVDNIVSSLGIEQENDNLVKKIVKLENYISAEVSSSTDKLKGQNLNVYTLGTGKYIINQYPLRNAEVLEGNKIFLVSNSSDYVMEDINGWSLNEVMTYANLLGVELKTEGYGYVNSQSIAPGTPITDDMVLTVTLSNN